MEILRNSNINISDVASLRQYARDRLFKVDDLAEESLYKPLLDAEHGSFFKDNYVLEILDVMSRPEYFWYTCKYLLNIELAPFQLMILQELWKRKFPLFVASRGAGKTWILALYAMLRGLFSEHCKVIVVGAAFRQSKFIFEYMESFWKNSPILRHIVGTGRSQGPRRDIDRCTFRVGTSEVIAIPIGDGQKIRGLRANYTLVDEFAALPQEIFEVVIKGFSSVSASPVERSVNREYIQVLKSLGMYLEAEDEEDLQGFGNQTVITGTASYYFNHYYDYWNRYKAIVESCGNQNALEEIFHGEIPAGFDWTQFSVMRIPWQKLPDGFMDESQLSHAKATMHSSLYGMEYECIFMKDSNGFFRRSLIESCVTTKPIILPSGPVQFSTALAGNPNLQYVYGIDPASESDNFAIVVLEIHPDHRRIVYCWTMTRQRLRDMRLGTSEIGQDSFYNYCARKIRNLMKIFPTTHIGMDTQGGGIAVMEALHDKRNLEDGEYPIWPYIARKDKEPFFWEKPDKPTDGEPGLHYLHMVQFANSEFVVNANHWLRKDFETHSTLFPEFNSVEIALAIENDKIIGRTHDTLEDAVMDIEELKDELSTIQHSQTPQGRDKWDTPEIKEPGGKKSRLRKDRYTALIIANIIAHIMNEDVTLPQYHLAGGFVGQDRKKNEGVMYVGPDHIVSKMNRFVGRGV